MREIPKKPASRKLKAQTLPSTTLTTQINQTIASIRVECVIVKIFVGSRIRSKGKEKDGGKIIYWLGLEVGGASGARRW